MKKTATIPPNSKWELRAVAATAQELRSGVNLGQHTRAIAQICAKSWIDLKKVTDQATSAWKIGV
jgi:hypothetical protein